MALSRVSLQPIIIAILSVLCVMSLIGLRIVPLLIANDLPVVELVDICLVSLIVYKVYRIWLEKAIVCWNRGGGDDLVLQA